MLQLGNLKSKLLAEQTEEELYNYILTEDLPVGTKLPNEFRLGEKFGVGRSTVREAVKALVSKGVLKIRRGAGTFVAHTVPLEYRARKTPTPQDKYETAQDLLEFRLIFEPAVAELCAQRAAPEEIAELERLCRKIEQLIDAKVSYIKEDSDFHKLIAQASGNPVVRDIIPALDTAILLFTNITHFALEQETIMTHRMLVRAIRSRDGLGARNAMIMHLTFNRDLILKNQEEQAPDI